MLASVIANAACTPLEVVRTRLLLQRGGGSDTQYGGILDALAVIRREEGLETLYKGLYARVAWNGVWLGAVLGVQRSYYAPTQQFFLDVVGAAAAGLGSSLEELSRYFM